MKIVVVGPGAIGLLWYYKLSQNVTNKVSLLCSKHTGKTHQLHFLDNDNQQHHQKIDYAAEIDLQVADIIIFCLKAYQLTTAFAQYLNDTTTNAAIVLCHNGMLNSAELPDKHRVFAMLLTHGSKRKQQFSIEHTGLGHSDIGLVQGITSPEEISQLVTTFGIALSKVYWHEDISTKQWLKLAINCVINPLTAINDCDNGTLEQEKYYDIIERILAELVTIASLNKIELTLPTLKKNVLDVIAKTAKNSSSMRSDILACRVTEVEHINGFVHQQGLLHNVATPENTNLWQQIKNLELKNKTK